MKLPLITLAVALSNAAAEFSAIAGSFEDVTSVVINPSCPDGGGKIPVTMFTILPTSDTEIAMVSSDPADLVNVSNNGGTLSITSWNNSSSKSGGVQIKLPADLLKSIKLGGDVDAQILDGFTAIDSVDLSGDSELVATISSSSLSAIEILVEGDSTLTMSTTTSVTGNVFGNSQVSLETPSYDKFEVSGDSNVEVKGNVGSGTVKEDSRVTITGEVTGLVSLSEDSEFDAPFCDNVETVDDEDSGCSAGSQDVFVDVSEQSMTKSVATFQCVGGGDSVEISYSNGGHVGVLTMIARGTIITAAVMFANLI